MDLKLQAAQKALEYVADGMVLGLGSGSTTTLFIDLLGQKVLAGGLHRLHCVPTSESTAAQARRLGLPISSLAQYSTLDLAVDGADEVDSSLNLIKGLGMALLREKLVEIHARQFIVIVDESKLVEKLGQRGPLPIEIVPFEWQATLRWLNTLECRAELWLQEDGKPFTTDNGNYLVRAWFENPAPPRELVGIQNLELLSRLLADRPGVVEHGLFLGMADRVIVAGTAGLKIVERKVERLI